MVDDPDATAPCLDPEALRAWARGSVAAVSRWRAELDAANVFPVADSDTGTNLFLTLTEAVRTVERMSPGASSQDVARALARGALVGARGNSGVIVGQYVGVLARHLACTSGVDDLVAGLTEAADAAYRAVARPVEGTVLTVAREISDRARAQLDDPAADHGLVPVLIAAVDQGYTALLRTPDQLLTLRAAGVLDAGARGLLVVLDALVAVLGGTDDRPPPGSLGAAPAGSRGGDHGHHLEEDHDREACGSGEFEVMYLLSEDDELGTDADAAGGQTLRAALDGLGDSVAVVGGDGLWQVHVHTDDPVGAVDVPLTMGTRPQQIRVRHLGSHGAHGDEHPALGLVTVASAPGLVPDLARAGAVVVLVPDDGVAGGELGRAVDDTGADHVLVLAGAGLVVDHDDLRAGGAVVELVAGLNEVQVAIGAATFAGGDRTCDASVLLGEVRGAVEAVRAVHVPGDASGGGEEHGRALCAALEPLLAGADLVTVLTSTGTSGAALDALRAGVADLGVELVVLAGGRPGADVDLGVE